MSTTKIRALIGKKWDFKDFKMRKDRDEAGDTESLNSDESSLPKEEASPPPMGEPPTPNRSSSSSLFEGINPVLHEETVTTTPM